MGAHEDERGLDKAEVVGSNPTHTTMGRGVAPRVIPVRVRLPMTGKIRWVRIPPGPSDVPWQSGYALPS